MSFDLSEPADSNISPPSVCLNNQGENLNDNILQGVGCKNIKLIVASLVNFQFSALGLRGFRTDDILGPRVSAHQVASYANGATPFIEELDGLSTEIIVTSTKRNANYAHRGWSVGATATISPWTSSRIAARNQFNAEGTWYTRLTKTKKLKVEALLEDLSPVPEFEAAIEDALRRTTTFEKFQAIYRALGRWGDVVPLEVELGCSVGSTSEKLDHVQLPEMNERDQSSVAWLSTTKNADVTLSGADLDLVSNDDVRAATKAHRPQWKVITVGKVASTITLLASSLQAQLYELYAGRLSYIPSDGVGPTDHGHRTYDNIKHASKTISSITIRCSNWIELLSATYSDGVTSSKQGGGGHVGTEYEFTLETGEHISEMLIWIEGDWLFGLQFITTMGRCSPQYGATWGIPTIARSRGGVLAGFLSHTKLHPTFKEMGSRIQGVWRHDLMPRVPKEDDVYSEYFGDKNQNGRGFNDRVLVGNSNSIHISSVQVCSGDAIDSIQFTYTANKDGRQVKSSTIRHGGPGGVFRQFSLEDGENIVTISGRHEVNHITQLCFGTSRGGNHDNISCPDFYIMASRSHK
ncbi:unnamed protein product [Rhizoctonia solani]|uniref:Jacalin-type lectin domain-containing protein n=1 Tax=Rhizoctonia solani TaxID=456999 RepID=A0A8H3C9D7_9AGAM|nr:unnamed protein product [Rhizoctonia solani]